MMAVPVILACVVIFAISQTETSVGEGDEGNSGADASEEATLIDIESKTENGKVYLYAKYGYNGIYYQLKFYINSNNAIYQQFKENDVTTIKCYSDSSLTIPSTDDNISLVLPGELTYDSKQYTVCYNGYVLEKTPQIKKIIITGNPSFNSNGVNTYPTLMNTSVKTVVYTGTPTFPSMYVLTKTVIVNESYDKYASKGVLSLENVIFRSKIDNLPLTFISLGTFNTPTDGNLTITFESGVKQLQYSLVAFHAMKYENSSNVPKLIYRFGEQAERPGSLKVSSNTNSSNTTFQIDIGSGYWASYVEDGKLANSIDGNLDDYLKNGRVSVIGDPAHSITSTASVGGTVSFPEKASYGQSVTVVPIPNEGYILGKLSISYGTEVKELGSDRVFVMPDSDVTIVATFVKLVPLEIDASSSGSQVSLTVTVTGTQDGMSPASMIVFVKYGGSSNGDRFARVVVPIGGYGGSFTTSLTTSMSSFQPVECLVQIFSESGHLLNQKTQTIGS